MIFCSGLVVAKIVAVLFLAVQTPTAAVTGTCASIGYDTQCCPPGKDCEANDGDCRCNADCHNFEDCCSDVHCPSSV